MDNKFFANFNNKAKRVPICFCIDVSRSMDEIVEGFEFGKQTGERVFDDQREYEYIDSSDPRCKTKMDKIIEGLSNFYKAVINDDMACDSCESAIITFNDDAKVFEGFDMTENKKVPTFPNPEGNTNVSLAIRKALNLIKERQQLYLDNKIKSFPPWLVLFTDGQPTDDTTLIQQELLELQSEEKLVVYTMALSDNEDLLKKLKGFSTMPPIQCSEPKSIQKFFTFLAKSVSIKSSNGIPKGFFS